MREAQSGPSSAALPTSAKSATHSFSRGRKSGRHRNFPVSFQFKAEMPRFVSSTSRAPRWTSQQTSNANFGLTLIPAPSAVDFCDCNYGRPSTHARRRPSCGRCASTDTPRLFRSLLRAGPCSPHEAASPLHIRRTPACAGAAIARKCWPGVMREFRQLVQRQPRLTLPRAQHHVAKHVALPSPGNAKEFPSLSLSHLRLLPAGVYSSAGNSSVVVLGASSRSTFFAFFHSLLTHRYY